jgi:glycosyltransferase involved in cell wall biosynthesis
LDFQICISNNCSTDETEKIVQSYIGKLPIKYQKNETNLGVARNVLKAIEMADSDFVWLIGDDDLLMPNGIEEVIALTEEHLGVDYFYVNSYHLTTEYVHSYPQPFHTKNLPKNMTAFSSYKGSCEMPFLDLIQPEISFDFLGGMFLAVFRKTNWNKSLHVLNQEALKDSRSFSYFDNTFVHVKIFANAFAKSKAYFCEKPMSVCLTGAREWAPLYSMVRSVRLIEGLEEYRKNGLNFFSYIRCRNFALGYFLPDLINIFLHRDKSGWEYISPLRLIVVNSLYPNMYLSIVYFLFRKNQSFNQKNSCSN